MKILVTGSSGFIGYHLVKRLLHEGHNVIGIDSHNDYYNASLKLARLKNLEDFSAQQETKGTFNFRNLNLIEKDKLIQLFDTENFSIVVHLAAQAGVRYSITNPDSYIESNLVGFSNILEASRKASIEHLVFASSSSVYGKNINFTFSEQDSANFPVSLYAATKDQTNYWPILIAIFIRFP